MPFRSSIQTLLRELAQLDWKRDGWRDLLCVLFLLSVGWHLAGHDGGKPLASLLPGLALGVLVIGATYRELGRLSVTTRCLVLGWSLGPLLAFAFAHVRAGWVQPTAALALATPAFLATRRLWLRPRGPWIVGVVAAAALLRAWWEAFLAFWGGSGGNAWLAVSWHNQSATLMGVMALLGFGLAAGGRGWVRASGFLLAGLGGAGVWLAASRAAFVLALLALGVGGIVALRDQGARRVAVAAGGTLTLSAAVTLALGSMAAAPGTGAERLTERGFDSGNLMVRFDYWQGAWGMLRDAPLTGTGPGSYPWASLPHASFGTSRSASVHNEYLDVLAGHGLLGGLPVWVVTLAGAWLVILAMTGGLTGVPGSAPSGRRAGIVAAAAVLTLLGIHAGFDFDWDYPILLTAAAVALAVLQTARACTAQFSGAQAGTGGPPPWSAARPLLSGGAATGASLILVFAFWGTWVQSGPGVAPWELDRSLNETRRHLEGERTAEARQVLSRAASWHPGSPSLSALVAITEFRDGLLPADALAERTNGFPAMDDRLLAAQMLAEAGHGLEARQVLDRLRPFIEERRRWRVRPRVVRLATLSTYVALEMGGCAAAERALSREEEWAETLGIEAQELRSGMIAMEAAALACPQIRP